MKDTATRASFSVIDRVRGLAEPLARSMGMDIWGIEFQPAGRSMLRIYLEGPGGVGIDECAEFSRLVGLSLEVEDVIPSAYTLEVSSPGLERTFFEEAQLAPYAGTGDLLELQLLEAPAARPGRRKFTGLLVSVKDGSFSFQPVDGEGMAPQGEPFDITWPDIKKIRCLYYAPPSRKPDGRKTAAKKTPPAPATEQAPTPVLEDSHELGT